MLLLIILLGIHALLCLACLGGVDELLGPWPLAWHDHPMHFHNAVVTRSFLVQSGTTAGYDPYFMAGYAKSIVSDPSGAFIDVVVAIFGRDHPAVTYKLLVLGIMAVLPWLIAGTIRLFGGGLDAVLAGTTVFLIYLWNDFPLEYARFGMITFLLVVPLGLFELSLFVRYLDRGGFLGWLLATIGASVLLLVHPLSILTVGPAVVVSALVALINGRRREEHVSISRHLGVLLMPVVVVISNAFWWLPALSLSSTRDTEGADFFSHPEPVWERVAQIFGFVEPVQHPIQAVLLGGAVVGLIALIHRRFSQGIALGVFLAAALFWGYFAGGFRLFDFLQPGRNTYAAYAAGAVATGIGWSAIRGRLARSPGRLDGGVLLALILIGGRLFVPSTIQNIRFRTALELVPSIQRGVDGWPVVRFLEPTGQPPLLTSRATPQMTRLIEQIRQHFGPGDRIFFEEGGQANGELIDPFGGLRLGGLLPTLLGVEVIGGPFLHVPVRQNFTQFGMGKLCGIDQWGLEEFERFARLYGPEGIVCWSPRAREFCRNHPEICEIVVDHEAMLIAKIQGFEGDAIRGEAVVHAEAGRLEVEPIAADVDGMIVLRYHSVPGLRSEPPGLLRAVEEPGDPVPFIGVDGAEGPLTIEWGGPDSP